MCLVLNYPYLRLEVTDLAIDDGLHRDQLHTIISQERYISLPERHVLPLVDTRARRRRYLAVEPVLEVQVLSTYVYIHTTDWMRKTHPTRRVRNI